MVIPNFQNRHSLSDQNASGFTEWLHQCLEKGHEIWAHGLTHSCQDDATHPAWWKPRAWVNQYWTQNESEFLGLTLKEKHARLRQSLGLFAAHEIPVTGFTPPTWWGAFSSQDLWEASEGSVQFQDQRMGIQNVETGMKKFCPAVVWPASTTPSHVWGGSWFLEMLKRFPLIRFALHPSDAIHSDLWPTLEEMGKGRQLIQTKTLFSTLPMVDENPIDNACHEIEKDVQ